MIKTKVAQAPGTIVLKPLDGGELISLRQAVVIGRSNSCDVVINRSFMSRQHAKLVPGKWEVVVEDLGSINGTYVNENKISGRVSARHKDTIRFDTLVYEIRITADLDDIANISDNLPATLTSNNDSNKEFGNNSLAFIQSDIDINIEKDEDDIASINDTSVDMKVVSVMDEYQTNNTNVYTNISDVVEVDTDDFAVIDNVEPPELFNSEDDAINPNGWTSRINTKRIKNKANGDSRWKESRLPFSKKSVNGSAPSTKNSTQVNGSGQLENSVNKKQKNTQRVNNNVINNQLINDQGQDDEEVRYTDTVNIPVVKQKINNKQIDTDKRVSSTKNRNGSADKSKSRKNSLPENSYNVRTTINNSNDQKKLNGHVLSNRYNSKQSNNIDVNGSRSRAESNNQTESRRRRSGSYNGSVNGHDSARGNGKQVQVKANIDRANYGNSRLDANSRNQSDSTNSRISNDRRTNEYNGRRVGSDAIQTTAKNDRREGRTSNYHSSQAHKGHSPVINNSNQAAIYSRQGNNGSGVANGAQPHKYNSRQESDNNVRINNTRQVNGASVRVNNNTRQGNEHSAQVNGKNLQSNGNNVRVTSNVRRGNENNVRVTNNTRQSNGNNVRVSSNARQGNENSVRVNNNTRQSNGNNVRVSSNARPGNENSVRVNNNTRQSNGNNVRVSSNARQGNENSVRVNNNTRQSNGNNVRVNSNARQGNENSARVNSNTRQSNGNNVRVNSNARQGNENNARVNNNTRQSNGNNVRVSSNARQGNGNNVRVNNNTRQSNEKNTRENNSRRSNESRVQNKATSQAGRRTRTDGVSHNQINNAGNQVNDHGVRRNNQNNTRTNNDQVNGRGSRSTRSKGGQVTSTNNSQAGKNTSRGGSYNNRQTQGSSNNYQNGNQNNSRTNSNHVGNGTRNPGYNNQQVVNNRALDADSKPTGMGSAAEVNRAVNSQAAVSKSTSRSASVVDNNLANSKRTMGGQDNNQIQAASVNNKQLAANNIKKTATNNAVVTANSGRKRNTQFPRMSDTSRQVKLSSSIKNTAAPIAGADSINWAVGADKLAESTSKISGGDFRGKTVQFDSVDQDVDLDGASAVLIGLSGEAKGAVYPLRSRKKVAKWEMGRAESSNVMISDPSVSRNHAQLINDNGRWKLVDLMSANGTYVNGNKSLTSYLNSGDTVRCGSLEFLFKKGEGKSGGRRGRQNIAVWALAFFAATTGVVLFGFFIKSF